MTLEVGFMMTESAEMGRRTSSLLLAMSMMTTWLVSLTFSRTQMKRSDSIVRVLKLMLAALTPKDVSYYRKKALLVLA